MSQPVKLSDSLVLDARITGEVVERSIAGQVEYWAKLGRAVEQLIQGPQVLLLCRNAASRPLSSCLETVDSAEGHQRVTDFLHSQPFPHYEPHPNQLGLLVQIEENGSRTVGRFVNRRFQPVKAKNKKIEIAADRPVTSQDSALDLAVKQTKAASPVKQKPSVSHASVVLVKTKAGRK
jgi:ParD-like antitoxin of type II bacterial toxin-antitoxin system